MGEQPVFEGGCLCGAVRYRATAAPVRCVICHCTMCRKHSGAPALAFVHFPADAFRWLGKAPSRYRSSAFAERAFCPDCGSTLSMHERVLEDRVQIAAGTLDDATGLRPDDHVWTRSQLPWLHIDDDLPKFARSSTAVPSEAPEDP